MCRIRQIHKDGRVDTLAGGDFGYADGQGGEAKFRHPHSVAVDPNTGNVYVADTYNHCIRCVTRTGKVSTVATPAAKETLQQFSNSGHTHTGEVHMDTATHHDTTNLLCMLMSQQSVC